MPETTKQNQIPPLPEKGVVVSDSALYLSQISNYRNSLAFGGMRNPTDMWATMMYNHPQAMLLYRELEEKDEDVGNALDSLRLKVLEREHKLVPGDESQLAQDTMKFVDEQLKAIPNFHGVLDCILDAPGYGFSVQEMLFDTSMGQAALIGVNDCPQELFLFGDRYQPQIGQLQFLDQPMAASGQPVPEEKFIVFTYRGRARNRMGRPLLKNVFWPSWFKRNVQRLWMQYCEKGPGTAVTRFNDSDSDSERRQAVAVAQALIDNVAVAIPNGMQIEAELLKGTRAMDPATYTKFFEAMQYSIVRKVLGETLTSFGNEGGTGSRAQGDTHADTLDSRVVELCRATAAVLNWQLVRPLVLWNFGPNAPLPQWSFDLGQEEDLTQRLETDSGLQRMGKQFTAGYISARYDVPLVEGEDPDAIMQPNVNAPQLTLRDTVASAFAEVERRATEARTPQAVREQAHKEMSEFDALFDQLRKEATGVLRERTAEIADAAVPVTEA